MPYHGHMDWNDLPHDVRHDLFGGRGEVRVWNLLGGAHAPPFSAVLRCSLQPGGSVGAHRQQRDPELIVCIDGTGRLTIDGQHMDFLPGLTAYLPHGSQLAIHNASDETDLIYTIIKAQVSG